MLLEFSDSEVQSEMRSADTPFSGMRWTPDESSGDMMRTSPINYSYYSFPSPISGRSPTLPSFRVPKYGYYNIEGESQTSTIPLVEPKNILSTKQGKHSTTFQACVQSINFFVGIGVLALPYTLRVTGWFGLVLLLSFGIIMAYSALTIGKNRRKFTLENFSDHIEFAFSTIERVVISVIFYTALLLNTALFLKLLAATLSTLTAWSHGLCLGIATAVFVLIANTCAWKVFSPALRTIGLVGTVSTIALLGVLICAEALALRDRVQIGQAITQPGELVSVEQHIVDRVYWTDAVAVLKTLGIFGYCYMGHEVFPSIFHNMQQPRYYGVVVYIAFATMITSYALIATLGYLAFNSRAHGNITENLPSGQILTVVTHVCVLVTTLTKLCLTSVPLTEGLLEWTRLVIYLLSRSKQLSGLIGQAGRAMPRLRLHTDDALYTPKHTPRYRKTTPNTYGTYTTTAESTYYGSPRTWRMWSPHNKLRRGGSPRHLHTVQESVEPGDAKIGAESIQARLNLPGHLRPPALSTAASPPQQAPPPQLPFPHLMEQPLRHKSRQGLVPTQRHASMGTTPRRALTWSDTIPIPPIRSPSSENLLALPSSLGSLGSLGKRPIVGTSSGMILMHQDGSLFGPASLSDHDNSTPDRISEIEKFAAELDNSSSISSPMSPLSPLAPLLEEQNVKEAVGATDDPTERALLYYQYPSPKHLPESTATSPTESDSRCLGMHRNLADLLLTIVMRTAVPIAALGISLLFRNVVSMIVFIGGVCGGLVSIAIPTLAYYHIHHQELSSREKYTAWLMVAVGTGLALTTLTAFLL